jgi:hypothetical protein
MAFQALPALPKLEGLHRPFQAATAAFQTSPAPSAPGGFSRLLSDPFTDPETGVFWDP